MATTVNILCYKSKTLSNGENPLMIRICKDGKKKYKSLGISVNPINWDFKKGKPKSKCPNKDAIEKLISEKKKEFTDEIVKLKSENKQFTTSTLVEKVSNPVKLKTVGEVFLKQIERLSDEKRRGYMLSFKQVYNSLMRFNKHLNIYFSDIDVAWLKKYETWLRKEGLAENTIGIRFRTLRAIYNVAIDENLVKTNIYPFKSFKVSKLHEVTAKRSITKEEVNKVIAYQSSNEYSALAIDFFTFSYIMGGINFVDIAYLTKENLIDNRLIYTRRKTKKLIKLPLQDKAIELIIKYNKADNQYLFPILSCSHKTDQQRANRVHKVITKVNERLKSIGKDLEITIDLTTYVARHSFATVLKRSGVSTSIICESLGHSSEKVTQIYLDSFENSQIDEAMRNLL
ncbi:MAG: phage integrase SAM-like domain-containing protein [Macellibacteroides fermentans]|uniref:phage integrase SAM-like domain-containing protein n=1 Tax=Macellibacteroides fermentans TaxID=879969 RepID=UPI003AC72527